MEKVEKLSDLPNIGKTLEALLAEIGINSYEDLVETGPVEIVKRLELSDDACINKLYALEGAIRGIRWHNLPTKIKQELKSSYFER